MVAYQADPPPASTWALVYVLAVLFIQLSTYCLREQRGWHKSSDTCTRLAPGSILAQPRDPGTQD